MEALRGDHKVAGLRWLHGKGLCHACAHLDVCRKRLLLRLQHGEVLVDRDDSIDVSRKSERGLQRSGSHVHGLAAAVYSKDFPRARGLAQKLRAGTVWINCYDTFDAALPFGGFKASGIGRELGESGLMAYLEQKTMVVAM